MEKIVTRELDMHIFGAFWRFDVGSLAAATLGQVESLALRDGRQVVAKVQRPGMDKQIADDVEVLGKIANWLDEHTEFGRRHRLQLIVEKFRVVLQQELNYERKANNLTMMAKNLDGLERTFVPRPIADYATRRVLTMDYAQGTRHRAARSPRWGPFTAFEMPGDLWLRNCSGRT